eukprot:jgi/Mesvir1/5469/Mv15523-RA.1
MTCRVLLFICVLVVGLGRCELTGHTVAAEDETALNDARAGSRRFLGATESLRLWKVLPGGGPEDEPLWMGQTTGCSRCQDNTNVTRDHVEPLADGVPQTLAGGGSVRARWHMAFPFAASFHPDRGSSALSTNQPRRSPNQQASSPNKPACHRRAASIVAASALYPFDVLEVQVVPVMAPRRDPLRGSVHVTEDVMAGMAGLLGSLRRDAWGEAAVGRKAWGRVESPAGGQGQGGGGGRAVHDARASHHLYVHSVRRQLVGSGFHRRLDIDVTLAVPTGWERECRAPPPVSATVGGDELGVDACQKISCLDNGVEPRPLPAGAYPNAFELQGLAALGQGPLVRVLGEVDLEKPAHVCPQSMVVAFVPIPGATGSSNGGDGHAPPAAPASSAMMSSHTLVTVRAPLSLHGRYQEVTLPGLWGPDVLGSADEPYRTVLLPPPSLYIFYCGGPGSWGPMEAANVIMWQLPVATATHAVWVEAVTMGVAAGGALLVCAVAVLQAGKGPV